MIPGQSAALGVPSTSLNGSAPHCQHFEGLAAVAPQSDHCLVCQAHAAHLDVLRVCLTCGWVACSDESPNQHAKAHYEETDHPLAVGLEPGSHWRWCYVHQRLV
jgi:uncharacterized UBP type Zn finger protein